MRCLTCGYEEITGSICSQCHTPLPVKAKKSAERPSTPSTPPKSATPPTAEPPKEKFRRRPLMDLDLTIPELETEEERQAKLKESSEKDKKS